MRPRPPQAFEPHREGRGSLRYPRGLQPRLRAGEVATRNVGSALMLPELRDQIPSEQRLGSATTETAYDPRKCHEAVAVRHAHAVIPLR